MNIHEHQAKQILKKYGAIVPEGVFALSVDELVKKAKMLNTQKYVLKAQIHAGGRGKAGGVKILDTIDELNKAWGNVFWSMEYNNFEEIELPNLTVTEANPSHNFNFQLFSSDQVRKFNLAQVEIINKYSPGRPVSHNYMGHFTEFDHREVSQDLEIAAWDSYPLGFLQNMQVIAREDQKLLQECYRIGDPDFQSYHHDLYRGMGRL